jgi:hypothetical protein
MNEFEDNKYWWRSAHPEDNSKSSKFIISIEAMQDIMMRKFQTKICESQLDEISLQEWIEINKEEIKDMTYTQIIEKYEDMLHSCRTKDCVPELNDIDLQDWIDVYENDIKELNFDQIVNKYDVKFYEPTSELFVVQICY